MARPRASPFGRNAPVDHQHFKERRGAADLEPGPNRFNAWTNFFPVIPEFVSDDRARIVELKRQISDDEWRRCQTLAQTAFSTLALEQSAGGQLALGPNSPAPAARPRARVRDGSPLRARLPATALVAPSRAARRIKWCLAILGAVALCFLAGIVTRAYWLTIPVLASPIVLPVLILSYVDWVRQGALVSSPRLLTRATEVLPPPTCPSIPAWARSA